MTRVGTANRIEGWGKGGGQQTEVLQRVQGSWVKNTKPLQ
jgi:hypothetical protein